MTRRRRTTKKAPPPPRGLIARLTAYLDDPERRRRIAYATLGCSLTLGAIKMADELRQVLDGMDDDHAPRD